MTEGFKTPYALMTEKVLQHLESNNIPWAGQGAVTSVIPPINFATGVSFRGINAVMTMISTIENGFSIPAFATFNQIRGKQVGGKIVKGAKASHVYYSSTYEREPRAGEARRVNDSGKVEQVFLKGFAVFNIDQVTEHDLDLSKVSVSENPEGILTRIDEGTRDHLAADLAMAMVSWRSGAAASFRHQGKLSGWIDALQKDDRAFYRAATKAQRITDKLFGTKDADDPGDEEGTRAA
ncbi:ArdC family protein [Agrobacterium sp. CCNWLW32]|uniref:ArdC family protein n=1 Tax=Agrobacterium sp. CCNWLW32 TaxID=3122072 RepID=UPI003010048A